MHLSISTFVLPATAVLLCVVLSACSSAPEQGKRRSASRAPAPDIPISVDFSGSWEMDYGRSDNVQQKLDSLYRELQRDAERRARAQSSDRRTRGPTVNVGPSNNQVRSLVALARMAELTTASQVLEIAQSDASIEVKREENFALNCVFQDRAPEAQEDQLGNEICGWDAHQLIFIISLPDGLRINHRMTMAEDGQSLHVATSVDSSEARAPFQLNRIYYRFDPLPPDYDCEYTLSKGNVCRRNPS